MKQLLNDQTVVIYVQKCSFEKSTYTFSLLLFFSFRSFQNKIFKNYYCFIKYLFKNDRDRKIRDFPFHTVVILTKTHAIIYSTNP